MLRVNKKGASAGGTMTIVAIVIVAFIFYAFANGQNQDSADRTILKDTFQCKDYGGGNKNDCLDFDNRLGKDTYNYGIVKFLFQYIFGMHQGILTQLMGGSSGSATDTTTGKITGSFGADLNSLSIRGVMIIIATWVIFFLIFSDMAVVVTFSNNKMMGFLIGIAVTVIFANFGLWYWIIIWLMGIMSFMAGLAVIGALLSIIVLGVAAHWGSQWAFGKILIKRQIWNIEAGGAETASAIKALKEQAEAFKS